jgi:hypothetical protein
MKTTRMMVTVVLTAGAGLALHVVQAQQQGIKRTDLQRHDPLREERRQRQRCGAGHLCRREREAAPRAGQMSVQ